MTNSEQMLTALEDNNLEQAQTYFQQALVADEPDTLYSLAEELYAMGFFGTSNDNLPTIVGPIS